MGTNECSQPASKSRDSQDFGDISMVSKMAHFRKSTGPRWVKYIMLITHTPVRTMPIKHLSTISLLPFYLKDSTWIWLIWQHFVNWNTASEKLLGLVFAL